MTDNNKIYNLPKTETISYFNEAEWNKDLSVEEIAQREQLAELIYKDGVLNGVKVGPGNTESKSSEENRESRKNVNKTSLFLSSIVCPQSAFLNAATMLGNGTGMYVAGKLDNDDELVKESKVYIEPSSEFIMSEVATEIGKKIIKNGS